MAHLLLIDDHPLVQVALEAALAKAPIPLRLTAVDNEQAACHALQQYAVQLVILDINLPDSDGLELLKLLKRHRPALPVLIYSAQSERLYMQMAQAAGAAGYVIKSQSMPQLLSAILAVLGGQTVFPSDLGASATGGLPLTSKEQQVLSLLARGFSNLQIAQQLHISNKTVSTHKKNILEKTGASSVLDLAALWKAQH
ncbi:response regulator transcription factor [Mixta intestinalis]|jgi:two-component system response regulator FimZ (fimbrial Z protein)|uniref:Virulence factors putative positive transcription regulator BvgA n=1 Tax=Mixta intestinalis TaxID=1615494 RepID=A0A6P1PW23_9GAMM|nr:response regulator transcription factor [Mixta intestinalis]QHM70321.1 Virulence factors putative positive transcription regulator BvgA [Mixta intestinalis]